MVHGITIVFLLLAILFAATHFLAVAASLYWYHWWFDIMMHAWGGMLLVLGVHALSTFSWSPIQPTLKNVLIVLLVAVISWEVFEWFAGLYEPSTYVFETAKDILVGLSGGLVTHLFLRTYRMK
jgi:hypothetical protein